MAENVKVCDLDPTLKELLKKFRFRKETNNAAILIKVEANTQKIILEEEFDDITPEELAEELPASQPRFAAYSYAMTHEDGRISYPLCFFFFSPPGCKPEQQMMYAGSLKSLVHEIGFTKVFEVRSIEDFSEEWLIEKLKFFR